MDKKQLFTGIEPDVRQDQILIDSEANRPAMFAMISALNRVGVNFKLEGCVVTVGGAAPTNTWSVTSGHIFLNSEILKVDPQSGTFDSGTEFLAIDKVVTFDSRGDKVFKDGTPRQTWQKNRGVISNAGSVSGTQLDAINGEYLNELIYYKGVDKANQTEGRLISNDEKITTPLIVGDIILNSLNVQSSDSRYGTAIRSTNSAAKLAQNSLAYMASTQVKDVKTVNYGKLAVVNNISPLTIADSTQYDVFEYTSVGTLSVNMPIASNNKNRCIVLNALSGSISILNTGSGGSRVSDYYLDDRDVVGSGGGLFFTSASFISDGFRWLMVHYRASIACPYIYVNGEYFEEILKNQIGNKNYREEIIDITSTLKVGINIIKLSEEKDEKTFIDYLILDIDGKETPLFENRKIMINGDSHSFTITVPENFEKATLRAKGYYIRI